MADRVDEPRRKPLAKYKPGIYSALTNSRDAASIVSWDRPAIKCKLVREPGAKPPDELSKQGLGPKSVRSFWTDIKARYYPAPLLPSAFCGVANPFVPCADLRQST